MADFLRGGIWKGSSRELGLGVLRTVSGTGPQTGDSKQLL